MGTLWIKSILTNIYFGSGLFLQENDGIEYSLNSSCPRFSYLWCKRQPWCVCPPKTALGLILLTRNSEASLDRASILSLNGLSRSGNGGESGSVHIESDFLYNGKCWKFYFLITPRVIEAIGNITNQTVKFKFFVELLYYYFFLHMLMIALWGWQRNRASRGTHEAQTWREP